METIWNIFVTFYPVEPVESPMRRSVVKKPGVRVLSDESEDEPVASTSRGEQPKPKARNSTISREGDPEVPKSKGKQVKPRFKRKIRQSDFVS